MKKFTLSSLEASILNLQNFIDKQKYADLKVLEAGCGSITKLKFSKNHLITGIDISQKQLDRNEYIHQKILGDIQVYKFPPSSFDIIVCWHVLEHLKHPQKAIENFIHCIKKNGKIIIASPNPLSLKGLITKFTPHWFHVFVYRYIYGRKDAGKDDQAPFKTYMRFSITPDKISKLAAAKGLKTEIIGTNDAFDFWVGDYFKQKSALLYRVLNFLRKFLKVISFGKIGDSEFIIVLEKK